MLADFLSLSLSLYICAVKLKSGPILPFSKVKKWSIFSVAFVLFCFRKSRSPCRKKRIFEKQVKNTTKKQFLNLKSGSIMLRNIIGPLLTLTWTTFSL